MVNECQTPVHSPKQSQDRHGARGCHERSHLAATLLWDYASLALAPRQPSAHLYGSATASTGS